MRVAIVYDGCNYSETRTEQACQHDILENLTEAFDSLGYESICMPVFRHISGFLRQLYLAKPDVLFNICESISTRNEDEMKMAAILDTTPFPYTGSGPVALGLAQDKALSKSILQYARVPTPEFTVVHKPSELETMPAVEFPLIVKPVREDGSDGIEENAVVNNLEELTSRVEFVFREFKQQALVEKFIDGRELNVALLGDKPLPISEIIFSNGRKVCGYRAKWVEDSIEYSETTPCCPAKLKEDIREKIQDIAKRAAGTHECRGYTRIDIRLCSEGIPYVIDVNPNPDLSQDSGMVRSAKAAGLSFRDMVREIINLAINFDAKADALR